MMGRDDTPGKVLSREEAIEPERRNGAKPKAAVLSKPRARQEAAKVLGIALQTRYRKFLESAGDENATVVATADLAQCMYENVEFVIWALKSVGGMNPPPPEELRQISKPTQQPANDIPPPQPVKPPLDLLCTCPPLDYGILFRERHMTSCPKFKP
jgi:hypothetical protein